MSAPSTGLVVSLFILFTCISHSYGADLCEWEFGRSILVNDTLFFMGGNYTFQGPAGPSVNGISHILQLPGAPLTESAEQKLYSLNLNASFPVNGLLKDTFLHSTDSSQTQYVGGGAFFSDSNGTKLYSMAGYPDTATTGINTLNSYDIQHDNWSSASPGSEPLNKLNRYEAMYATTDSSGLGLGFIAGGQDWIPGMVIFDASDPKNLSWTNVTNNIPYFWGPATEYVRFGNKGVLIAVGGYTSIDNSEQRDMSAIQVYDIDSQQWFQVTATGNIPKSRSSFCSGLSAAPDDSSFQMTIYGGYNGAFGDSKGVGVTDDVYVLTMPSFRWIQITSQENSNVNVTSSRRHLCNTYEDRQMIVLGGDQSDPSGTTVTGCNVDYPPVKLLDTSTYTWQTTFPVPNGTYQVPAPVYNIIGGDGSGTATLTAPSSGFNATIGNAAASAIFSKRIARIQTVSSEQVSQNSPVPSNVASTSSPASGTNVTGAIVGAVLGSLVFIVALATLVFILRRRKMSRERIADDLNVQKTELSDQVPSPTLAPIKPGGRRLHELKGDDAHAQKPKELDAENNSDEGVMFAELDAANSTRATTEKGLPTLPHRADNQ